MRVLAFLLAALSLRATTFYVTVSGLGGEPEFEQRFEGWARDIDKSLQGIPDAKVTTLIKGTKAQVKSAFDAIAREAKPDDALVFMLIGHGAFDSVDYKINLVGPDLSATEIAALMDRVAVGRQLVVNMTSCSGASLQALKKPNRVVITATKSGTEKNATVFARYWIEGLRDSAADTDKNESISAQEAFKYASTKTAEFYTAQKRLATEHAAMDDKGMPAFALLRYGGAAQAARTPEKRALLTRKEALEAQIDALKLQKAALQTEDYKRQLTALLLELARTQQELDK